MIKFTLYDGKGRKSDDLYLRCSEIVALNEGNPSGTIITASRGTYHVAQSITQVLILMEKVET
jgi:hypothetical protein